MKSHTERAVFLCRAACVPDVKSASPAAASSAQVVRTESTSCCPLYSCNFSVRIKPPEYGVIYTESPREILGSSLSTTTAQQLYCTEMPARS
ncbi:hypothetical protein NQZ68_017236 [Dissostichus eleginoides]|nr:hypothetical protein NQZ68_017236 [Dissostichus eleginoides]